MGKKLDSLVKLSGMGLNTPDFEAIYSPEEINEKHFKAWDKVSIRLDTREKKDIIMLGFYPNRDYDEAIKIAKNALSENVIVIASKGIDPQGALMAGKFLKQPPHVLMEFIVGPGTVRDMELGEKKVYSVDATGRLFPSLFPPEIRKYSGIFTVVKEVGLRRIRGDFCLEWSYYSEKVGKKNTRLIFWEIIDLSRSS